MKPVRKILCWLLIMSLSLSLLCTTALAETPTEGTCGEALTWTLSEEGVLTVSGTGAMEDFESYTDAPWYAHYESITAIVVEEGVTSIGNSAFSCCEALVSVTLPEGLLSIGSDAFSSCTGLESILLPQTLEEIGHYGFAWCEALSELVLPDSLRSIGDHCFTGCTGLTSLQIPPQVSHIGPGAFSRCSGLAWLAVAEENEAFASDDTGALLTKDLTTLLCVPAGITERYVAAPGVTAIGEFAFAGCMALTDIQLPDGVVSIGSSAFAGCEKLRTVTLPESLTSIESYAFSQCKALITVAIPQGLTHLGSWAFECCFSLKSIQIPEGITAIADFTFYECTSLKDVTLPQTLTAIGTHGFYVCKSLKTVELPEGLTTISGWAFAECYALAEITIPSTVTAIGGQAFLYDTVLSSVEFLGPAPTIGEQAFGSVTATVRYPVNLWTEEALQNYGGTLTWEPVGEPVDSPIPPEPVELSVPQIKSCYSKVQTSVKVTWNLIEGAHGYELWRSATPEDESSWIRVKTITDGTTDRYTNQDLTPGVTYYYSVRAFRVEETGETTYSAFSDIDYMPAAVVFDAPYSNATFRIRLRWGEIGGSHGYQIWRMDEENTWRVVKTLGDRDNTLTNDQGGTTAYSNCDLLPGKRYTYKMRAFRITEDGRKIFGAYSDEYTVSTKPEAPTLTLTALSGKAQLNWQSVEGAAGYHIWMSTQPDSGFTITKTLTGDATEYTKYGLESGMTYYFKLRCFAEVDGKKTFSEYSETLSITIP